MIGKNTADLVDKVGWLTISEDECLVSYDVTALFTNTPVNDSVNIIRGMLKRDTTLSQRTNLTPVDITKLVEFCLKTTYFTYRGDVYQQKEGAAMGSPLSPLAANAYMEHFEHVAMTTAPTPPSFWGRYVDDTFGKIKKSAIDSFTNHINIIHPAIKFPVEDEVENTLPMLDVLVHKKADDVYKKKTHTDQYLAADSHHPLQHKLGVIRFLYNRAEIVNTLKEYEENEKENIRDVLSKCGYSDWQFHLISRDKSQQRPPWRDNPMTSEGRVTILYVRGTSEALHHIFNKKGITVHFKPVNTLRQQLVNPKYKLAKQKPSGTVYFIQCEGCSAFYVGETERILGQRLAEHRRLSCSTSPVVLQAQSTHHTVDWNSVQILDKCDNWFEQGVRVTIQIRAVSIVMANATTCQGSTTTS